MGPWNCLVIVLPSIACSFPYYPGHVVPNSLLLKPLRHIPLSLLPFRQVMFLTFLQRIVLRVQPILLLLKCVNCPLPVHPFRCAVDPSPSFLCTPDGIIIQTQYLHTHKHRVGKAPFFFLRFSIYLPFSPRLHS